MSQKSGMGAREEKDQGGIVASLPAFHPYCLHDGGGAVCELG